MVRVSVWLASACVGLATLIVFGELALAKSDAVSGTAPPSAAVPSSSTAATASARNGEAQVVTGSIPAAKSSALAGSSPLAAPAMSARAASAPTWTKVVDEALGQWLSLCLKLAIVIVAPLSLWLLVKEWNRSPLIIESFDVPKDLQDLGLTGGVVSQMLCDQILDVQRSARIDDDPADIVFVELPRLQVDLQLPGMSWSIRNAIRYFKQALGRSENRVVGEVMRRRTTYVIRVRTAAGRSREVPVTFHGLADIGPALAAAAETAVLLVNPFEMASIESSRETPATGYTKTVEALRQHLATAPASNHQGAYVLWASLCRNIGDLDAMRSKLELAAEVRSKRFGLQWRVLGSRYCNFLGNLRKEEFRFSESKSLFDRALRWNSSNIGAMNNLAGLDLELWRLASAKRRFAKIIKSRPNSSRGYRGLGLVAARTGDYKQAVLWYRRAIDVAPFARWPRINVIEAQRRMGDLDGATRSIDQFNSIDPGFAPLLRTWGEVLLDQARNEEALVKFTGAVEMEPGQPWGFIGQAEALRRLNRFDESEKAARAALALRPNAVGAIARLANALRELNRQDEAVAEVWRAASMAPHDLYAQLSLADEWRRRAKFEEAQAVLERLPRDCRRVVDVRRAWGRLQLERGELRSACKTLGDALAAYPDDRWLQLELIDAQRRIGSLAEACDAARSHCHRRPGFVDGWRALGTCLNDAGDFEGGLAAFRRWAELDGASSQAQCALARSLLTVNKPGEAMIAVQAAVALNPHNGEALRRWGEVLHAQGRSSEVEAKLSAATLLASRDPWAHLALADHYLWAKSADPAIDAAKEALKVRPKLPGAAARLGEAMLLKGDVESATAQLESAISWAPGDPENHLRFARLLRKIECYDDALKAAQAALRTNPKHLGAWLECGEISTSRQDLQTASSHFLRCLEIDPNAWRAALGLAEVNRRLEHHESAWHYLGQAERLQGSATAATTKRADFLFSAGRYEQAAEALLEARVRRPQDGAICLDLARTRSRQHRFDEAIELVKRALELNPGDEWACRVWAQALSFKNDKVAAEKKLGEAVDAARWNPAALIDLSAFLNGQKRFEEAAAAANDALRIRPWSQLAMLRLGEAQRDKGQLEEAESAFGRAIRANPANARPYALLSDVLLRRNEARKAAATAGLALARNARLPEALRALANALQALGDMDGAVTKRCEAEAIGEERTRVGTPGQQANEPGAKAIEELSGPAWRRCKVKRQRGRAHRLERSTFSQRKQIGRDPSCGSKVIESDRHSL